MNKLFSWSITIFLEVRSDKAPNKLFLKFGLNFLLIQCSYKCSVKISRPLFPKFINNRQLVIFETIQLWIIRRRLKIISVYSAYRKTSTISIDIWRKRIPIKKSDKIFHSFRFYIYSKILRIFMLSFAQPFCPCSSNLRLCYLCLS